MFKRNLQSCFFSASKTLATLVNYGSPNMVSYLLPNFELSRFGTQNLEISRFDMNLVVFAAKSWEKKIGLVPNLPR